MTASKPKELSDAACRNAKTQAKPWKLHDARGLFLLVNPTGTKWWRLRYTWAGKDALLSLGVYPDVSRAVRGFVVRTTGEHVNSLYKFVGMEFGQAWIRLNPDAAWLDYFSNHPSKLGELVLAAQQG